jgi:hypothetical protein
LQERPAWAITRCEQAADASAFKTDYFLLRVSSPLAASWSAVAHLIMALARDAPIPIDAGS